MKVLLRDCYECRCRAGLFLDKTQDRGNKLINFHVVALWTLQHQASSQFSLFFRRNYRSYIHKVQGSRNFSRELNLVD